MAEYTVVFVLLLFSITIHTWLRIKLVLGGLIKRVRVKGGKIALAVGITMISLAYVVYTVTKAYPVLNAPNPFGYGSVLLDNLYQAIQGFASILTGMIQLLMSGQIREGGLYFGKILTWERMHSYRWEDPNLLIDLNKFKRSGKRKTVKLCPNEISIAPLIRALEDHGVMAIKRQLATITPEEGK